MVRIKEAAALAAGCMIFAGVWSGAAAQGGDGAVIKYRQNIMKSIGGHTGAIAQIVKGEAPHKSHLATHAQALRDLLAMVPDAFEQKTSGGKTRAKPDIWTDASGFKEAYNDAAKATKEFAEAAASGDEGAIGEKLDAVFDGCKGCHKNFREKKE